MMRVSYLDIGSKDGVDHITLTADNDQERRYIAFIASAIRRNSLELNAYDHLLDEEMTWFSSKALLPDNQTELFKTPEETKAEVVEELKNALGLKVVTPD